MLPIEENARLGCKVNVAAGKNSVRGQEPQKCIPAQKMAKYPAKFCWRPESEVAAVMKPKREAH